MFILLGGALVLGLSLFLSLWSPKLPLPACTPIHLSRNLRAKRKRENILPSHQPRDERTENGKEKGNVIWDPSARDEEQKKAK